MEGNDGGAGQPSLGTHLRAEARRLRKRGREGEPTKFPAQARRSFAMPYLILYLTATHAPPDAERTDVPPPVEPTVPYVAPGDQRIIEIATSGNRWQDTNTETEAFPPPVRIIKYVFRGSADCHSGQLLSHSSAGQEVSTDEDMEESGDVEESFLDAIDSAATPVRYTLDCSFCCCVC